MKKIKVGVVQAAPKLFDLNGSLTETEKWIAKANASGAGLVLFPEAFIPCYPRGLSFGSPVGSRSEKGKELWLNYWDNAIEVPGMATHKLGKMAKRFNIYLAIGIIEKEVNNGSLYCTLLYFSPSGELIGKHRKLKPTAAERIIWAEGDGTSLTTVKTEFGILGGLICWENYMPLARMSMYQKGVQIYLAPTADQRESWQASMQHIAREGRCFVLSANQYVTKSMYPKNLPGIEELEDQPEIMSAGGSAIIDPNGDYLVGPLWKQEGILFADLAPEVFIKSKLEFDVVGHYARNDVFKFKVKDQPPTIEG